MPQAPSLPRNKPRGIAGKVQCSTRELPVMPVPNLRKANALTDSKVLERFNVEAAGKRPAALERNDNVITIFDTIGEDWWTGEGVTAKSIARQLKAIGGDVEVQINSPGGDVFEGFAIYNLLREHPHNVHVKVIGMAASAASVIAMAGDTIAVGASAFIMIHNCWVVAVGNRHDMRETADFLEPFDMALRDLYVARTGQKPADVARWLDAETYMNGNEAVQRGFADELLPADAVVDDPQAAVHDHDVNAVRAMELTLLASGLSRTEARAKIQEIKGAKLGAGAGDGKLDAANGEQKEWAEAAQGFLASLKGQ